MNKTETPGYAAPPRSGHRPKKPVRLAYRSSALAAR
jgi:hypothetical protein